MNSNNNTRIHPRKSIQGKGSNEAGEPVDKEYAMYNLVDMHGGGELVPWMRYALNSGDYSLIGKEKSFLID